MNYKDIDAYFCMASMGDVFAYRQIYDYFYNESEIVIKSVLSTYQNKTISVDEFNSLVAILFMEAINDYDYNRAPFSLFTKYLIQLKLVRKVIHILDREKEKLMSLDDYVDEGITYHDTIEDESCQNETAASKFKYSLASKSMPSNRKEKRLERVKMMLYCGYSQTEIAKYLRLSRNEVRQLIRECKKDQTIINLKMELK